MQIYPVGLQGLNITWQLEGTLLQHTQADTPLHGCPFDSEMPHGKSV